MSPKLDKLNEVNTQLDKILKKIETHMFLENIDHNREKIVVVKQPKTSMQIK